MDYNFLHVLQYEIANTRKNLKKEINTLRERVKHLEDKIESLEIKGE